METETFPEWFQKNHQCSCTSLSRQKRLLSQREADPERSGPQTFTTEEGSQQCFTGQIVCCWMFLVIQVEEP